MQYPNWTPKKINAEERSLWKELEDKPLDRGVSKQGWIAFQTSDSDANLIANTESVALEIEDGKGKIHPTVISKPWPKMTAKVIDADLFHF